MKKLISFLFFIVLIMLSMLNIDSEARGKKTIEIKTPMAFSIPD